MFKVKGQGYRVKGHGHIVGSSSSSRNEYYLGGIISLLLQDHLQWWSNVSAAKSYNAAMDISATSNLAWRRNQSGI